MRRRAPTREDAAPSGVARRRSGTFPFMIAHRFATALLVLGSIVPFAGSAPAAPAGRVVDAAPRSVLPFIADDYTRALALARVRKVPLFIEAWAPW